LATTEDKLRIARGEVIEILKATSEGLDYSWTQREGTIEIIARWMNLSPAQAATTYDSVRRRERLNLTLRFKGSQQRFRIVEEKRVIWEG